MSAAMLAVLCAFFPVITAQGFWSLALEELTAADGQFVRPNCVSYHSSGLLTQEQYQLCQEDGLVLAAVSKGLRRAISDCQSNFAHQRWNCSAFEGAYILGRGVETIDSREGAYVRSLISAAILFDVAVACREGLLPQCPCHADSPYIRKLSDGTILLNGCGANPDYAKRTADVFLDSPGPLPLQDGLAVKTLDHNRLVSEQVLDSPHVVCKCHGLTNDCSIKTCVRHLRPFKQTSESMLQKYKSAIKVHAGVGEAPLSSWQGDDPTPNDLVYTQDSPNYCKANPALNILGTSERVCHFDETKPGSCQQLCCGRGQHETERVVLKQECKLVAIRDGNVIKGFSPKCTDVPRRIREYVCN
uniref:Protein Wnt n=1 Tax=Halisarca dujardinii TaxID=2583056 RepID=A0A175BXB7_HALDU